MYSSAIKLTGVGKRFKLYQNPVLGPLKERLFLWRRQHYYQERWAVRDASLEVRKGEVVGVIGPNGSGKTTLLKMIAGLLPVDEGVVEVNGKVTALLALGVGVSPEFTGRENLLYSGLLQGMSKRQVLSRMDSIIEFAELGEYIDQPFRTYSSGMRARLLFSISMSVEPDILIVDEALATGDAYFVQKCSQRIKEICRSGATILFVSHNVQQIQELCHRAVFMAEGKLLDQGSPDAMIDAYNRWTFEREANRWTEGNTGGTGAAEPANQHSLGRDTGEVVLHDIVLRRPFGEPDTGFNSGENMDLEFAYENHTGRALPVNVFVGFLQLPAQTLAGESTTRNLVESLGSTAAPRPVVLHERGTVKISFRPLLLLNNHYSLWIILAGRGTYYCEYKNVNPFFVADRQNCFYRGAVFWQPCTVEASSQEASARRLGA